MKEILHQRHPLYSQNQMFWQFYSDCYEGGALWPFKVNPLVQEGGTGVTAPVPAAAGVSTKFAATRYLWQFPMERTEKYLHRVARACYINIVAPVVDFYCATVGKPENIIFDSDEALAEFEDDVDLQGQSFTQFMLQPRTSATVRGLTFLFVDSTKATNGPIVTERDAKEQGIRPYLIEILPENLLNWRLDKNGTPLEIFFRVETEVPGGVLEKSAAQSCGWEYRYWDRSSWKVMVEEKGELVVMDQGTHELGIVPIVPLYHKRKRAMGGQSLLKDSAKLGQLCTNWVSALDEAFETQMFAIPVWKAKEPPADAGVGTAVVLHLDPDRNEEFTYVTPDTQPFEVGWDAFYRLIQMANKHMGISPKAITTDKIDDQSGTSKEWDFFEAEKILSAMATNEQEAAIAVFHLAAKWMGKTYTGSIQYATKYDLSSAAEDIEDMIKLQSAGVPETARKELMRRVVKKKLPSVSEAIAKKIDGEVDKMSPLPKLGELPAAPGGTARQPHSAAPSPGKAKVN